MVEGVGWEDVTEQVAASLRPRGFDLVHPFRVSWWDDTASPPERLGGDGSRLGLLVGNTRVLWRRFREDLDREPAERALADPLDRWTEREIGRGLAGLEHPHRVRFVHDPPPRRLPIQRLAARVGLAPLSPGRVLAHPRYGPWFALRAVVLVDVQGPGGVPREAAAPCAGCPAPCRAAFDRACELADARADHSVLHRRWQPWLAVRDACPVGRDHRYPDEQIRYHYARELPPERRGS